MRTASAAQTPTQLAPEASSAIPSHQSSPQPCTTPSHEAPPVHAESTQAPKQSASATQTPQQSPSATINDAVMSGLLPLHHTTAAGGTMTAASPQPQQPSPPAGVTTATQPTYSADDAATTAIPAQTAQHSTLTAAGSDAKTGQPKPQMLPDATFSVMNAVHLPKHGRNADGLTTPVTATQPQNLLESSVETHTDSQAVTHAPAAGSKRAAQPDQHSELLPRKVAKTETSPGFATQPLNAVDSAPADAPVSTSLSTPAALPITSTVKHNTAAATTDTVLVGTAGPDAAVLDLPLTDPHAATTTATDTPAASV